MNGAVSTAPTPSDNANLRLMRIAWSCMEVLSRREDAEPHEVSTRQGHFTIRNESALIRGNYMSGHKSGLWDPFTFVSDRGLRSPYSSSETARRLKCRKSCMGD